MIRFCQRVKNLGWDLMVFAEILFYWPFAVLVMKPAQRFDRRFGTRVFAVLDRIMRSIADL